MRRTLRFMLPLVMCLSVVLVATTAVAAPTQWKSVDVALHSEEAGGIMLVSGELPEAVKLPAEAELSVPAGAELQWVGQILGGEPSADPALTYTKTTVGDSDLYKFTMTESRIAQIEIKTNDALVFDGTNYAAALKWTATQDVPEVRISVRIPEGSKVVQAATGADIQPGSDGYSFYSKTVEGVSAGDKLDLAFSYQASAAAPAAAAPTASPRTNSSSSALILVVILIVAIGGLGFVAVSVNNKLSAKAARSQPAPAKSSAKGSHQKAQASPRKSSKGTRAVEPVPEPVPPRKVSPVIPALLIVGVIVGGFAIAGAKSTSAVVAEGKFSRNFGAASACQSASISFTPNDGVNLAQEAGQLLKGYEGMEGVGEVTVDIAGSKIDMAWCESSQSEDTMRQVLTASGLITLGQSASSAASESATATIDSSGKKQTASVDTASGTFSPGQLTLKAGVPAEISFGQAAGCLSEVVISQLGINQDLTKGPATVKLPALEAGTYDFACAMGHQSGQLVIQ